ncbi:ADP-ribosylation like factor [Cavenderia fasciculata]|uniref:ADP-ribosylation like factor n=1 Tax=Cavenderia fasciculata TaxID=261658 RepID=F4Q3F9_CACFS|nr:ADP-ribosylation like factor [Cavenderia fasciculata]EGG16828.1 ADP-ribosylation like factor [Cavenderia fasciculata]|eukprot:XP_004355302.1 ADP-ribosylation like factor [Cavenderia fasciculata]
MLRSSPELLKGSTDTFYCTNTTKSIIQEEEQTDQEKNNKDMGKGLSKLFSKKKETRVLMLGLDAAGKTSLLYRVKLKESVPSVPTVGFTVETIKFHNTSFTIWDVGGQDKIRNLWRHYYVGTQVLIYVIDSSDRERLEESKQQLYRVLNDPEMREPLLLVFANKCDIVGAMPVDEISEKLGLNQLVNRKWTIFASCAITGQGVEEGFSWLQDELLLSNKGKKKSSKSSKSNNNNNNNAASSSSTNTITPTPIQT